ncbi:hypothetical protein F0562_033276 [Nyssa sinensis]|uniref:Uncharacterized protein n=1 Tax=Nyssa sinensis TaxID=561372 RepID=A0A5J5AW01_9ASTE|nr:hypothetical protein F0562_033276 [Nyssa sinensis]
MTFMQQFGRTKSVAKRYLEEVLYKRLFKDGSSDVSVGKQGNQFFKSSKRGYKWEVGHSLKLLRQRKRFYPVLKVAGMEVADANLLRRGRKYYCCTQLHQLSWD